MNIPRWRWSWWCMCNYWEITKNSWKDKCCRNCGRRKK